MDKENDEHQTYLVDILQTIQTKVKTFNRENCRSTQLRRFFCTILIQYATGAVPIHFVQGNIDQPEFKYFHTREVYLG